MNALGDAVRYYLECFRSGDVETGFFGLLELPAALPSVIDEANDPANRSIRSHLIRVIWQYRRPEAIGFLGGALADPDPDVWKEALDGLVTIGGPESVRCIAAVLGRVQDGTLENSLSKEWLQEALEQINAK